MNELSPKIEAKILQPVTILCMDPVLVNLRFRLEREFFCVSIYIDYHSKFMPSATTIQNDFKQSLARVPIALLVTKQNSKMKWKMPKTPTLKIICKDIGWFGLAEKAIQNLIIYNQIPFSIKRLLEKSWREN
jgi:hypothetical protein